MKIDLKSTNLKLTPAIENYAKEMIYHLDKFIDKNLLDQNTVFAYLELAMTTKHHHKGNIFYAEADIKLPGKVIRGEVEANNIFAAIDGLKDKLSLELKKYKEKNESVFKKGARTLKDIFRNFSEQNNKNV